RLLGIELPRVDVERARNAPALAVAQGRAHHPVREQTAAYQRGTRSLRLLPTARCVTSRGGATSWWTCWVTRAFTRSRAMTRECGEGFCRSCACAALCSVTTSSRCRSSTQAGRLGRRTQSWPSLSTQWAWHAESMWTCSSCVPAAASLRLCV